MNKTKIHYKGYTLTSTPQGVEIRKMYANPESWPIAVVPDASTAKAKIDRFLKDMENRQGTLFD